MRYGMMIELDKCVGCKACVSACKERWDSGPGAARDWVHEYEGGTRDTGLSVTFFPGLCNQCNEHPCTEDCPTGATWLNEQGIVVVDPRVCIGCGNCVSSCPYGARHVDETKHIVEKCNLCAPFVARGELPACVKTCLAECRHFGDLGDGNSDLVRLINDRGAQALYTQDINPGPNVYYAPAEKREKILEAGVITPPSKTFLTRTWQSYTRPFAQAGVPAVAAVAALGGAVVNLRNRAAQVEASEKGNVFVLGHPKEGAGDLERSQTALPELLPRHRLGMRLLHWFNAFTWVLLVITGTALMLTPSFALFGTGLAEAIEKAAGGKEILIRFHAVWGILWALIIVPFFLYLKRGGIEALHEITPTLDDVRWMVYKPLVMLRLGRFALPPQDKYNAGQKAFALSALAGTALIIVTGLMMTFHLGPPELIRLAILGHKLAIALALVGLAVHITMAALIREERPALFSMFRGTIDREHAAHHSKKWVEELEQELDGSEERDRNKADNLGSHYE